MKTRLLETREILRATTSRAELLDATGATVLLKTTAKVAMHQTMQSTGADMFGLHLAGMAGEMIEGRARFDILSDDIIRVRYHEGDAVPDNHTAMVIGLPAGVSCSEIDRFDDRVVVTTDKVRLTIFLTSSVMKCMTCKASYFAASGETKKTIP